VVKIYRNSAQVLRQYGSFILNLLNDSKQGNLLIAQADDIENKRTAASNKSGLRAVIRHSDPQAIFDDDTGVVSMSTDADSLGCVLSANQAAANMFGRLRSELIGSNVSVLIPSPLAEMHNMFLSIFMQGASRNTMVNKTRKLFGLHKNGSIFPVSITIKQVSGGLSRNVFLAMITEERLKDKTHIAMLTSNGELRRCSAGAYNLLGTSQEDILEKSFPFSTWIQDYSPAVTAAENNSQAHVVQSGMEENATDGMSHHCIVLLL
jgi:PAS domain S-box-containing protein